MPDSPPRPRVIVFERQHKLNTGSMLQRTAVPIDQITGWSASSGTRVVMGGPNENVRGISIYAAGRTHTYDDADGSIEALLEYLLGPVDVQLVKTVNL